MLPGRVPPQRAMGGSSLAESSLAESSRAESSRAEKRGEGMPSLGLCVIARDAAETLAACLASVRGLVDQMVVVDTGAASAGAGEVVGEAAAISVTGAVAASAARTPTGAVAMACGARLVEFAWANDFAAARNRALEEMNTDWVLVLDADEELDGAAHAWIRRELLAPRADGYVVPVRNYLQPWDEPMAMGVELPEQERHPRAPDARLYARSQVCRLFKRDAEVYYVGKVHEQVEYRLMELGRKIAVAECFIHHFGWYLVDADRAQKKRGLYRDLLEEKLRDRPNDAQVLMQYGDALCSWAGQVREGLDCLMRSAELRPEYVEIWTHIAEALVKLGQMEAALVAVRQIPKDGPLAGRRAQLEGDVLAGMGRWDEASRAYAVALEHYPGFVRVRAKLGFLQQAAGDEQGGRAQMRLAARQAEAAARAQPSAQAFQRVAELYAQMPQWADVLRLVEEGLQYAPGAKSLGLAQQELKLRAAVAEGNMAAAAKAAGCLVESQPSPKASLRHAAVLMRNGEDMEALAALLAGLERFPLAEELQRAVRETSEAVDRKDRKSAREAGDAKEAMTAKEAKESPEAKESADAMALAEDAKDGMAAATELTGARWSGAGQSGSLEMRQGNAARAVVEAGVASSFQVAGR